mgnify:CR=1
IVGKALSDVLNIRSNPSEFVVHVRGGDFAFSDRIDDIQARAISRFASDNALSLRVVTNDTAFAADLFGFLDYEFLSKKSSARDDFETMCRARTLYLSNSTFA